jgi:hypothetical protein
LRDIPLPDGLELFRVIDRDVDAEVHPRLLQVHVEASNLGVADPSLHRCKRMQKRHVSSCHKCLCQKSVADGGRRTLGGDGAVERVALDKDGFGGALAVRLEDVDGLDGVLDVAAGVDRLDGEHRVDREVGKEGVVAVVGVPVRRSVPKLSLETRSQNCSESERKDARSDDLARHGRLCNVDEALFAERVDLDAQLLGEVPDGLLAREAVAGDDGGGVDFVLDEVVGAAEEFGGDNDDRGGAVSDLLVLLLRELDEDAPGGVFDFDQLEDGSAVVRDGDVLQADNMSVP